jgi:hypothetical protein
MERTMSNPRPIEEARNPLLRSAQTALQRAAIRARSIAAQTGTYLVIGRDAVVEFVDPASQSSADRVHEPITSYTAAP